ncbi:MAG: hypothetical protein HY904_01710 [Deltaproteobacteria bacterium]|nr:hypothetical protein [Deltaproteobacteria bacterium]
MPTTLIPLLLATLLGASAAEGPSLLVVPLRGAQGVGAPVLAALSEHVTTQARRIPGYRVVSTQDVQQLLTLEMQQQLTGCKQESCLAELAGALNVDEILYGSLSRLGQRGLVLTLNRVDARRAEALGAESDRLPLSDHDAMLDVSALTLQRLYPDYELPAARVQGMSRWRVAALMTGAGAVIQYAGVSTALFSTAAIFLFGAVFGLPLALPAVAFCVLAPVVTAGIQAWLLDLLGRRQVGFRTAALVGALLVPLLVALSAPAVVAGVMWGAFNGLVVGVAAGVLASVSMLGTRSFDAGLNTGAVATTLGLIESAGGGLCCLGLCGAPPLLAAVLGVPALQTWLLHRASSTRPVGEEPRLPGLFAPDEPPPGFLGVLPAWLQGGPVPDADTDADAVALEPDDEQP